MWLTQRTALVACRDARLVRPLKWLRVYVSLHCEQTHNPCVPTYPPCRFHLIIYRVEQSWGLLGTAIRGPLLLRSLNEHLFKQLPEWFDGRDLTAFACSMRTPNGGSEAHNVHVGVLTEDN